MLFFYRPFIWSITKFEATKICHQSDFPKFSLLPAPEDGRQNYEWDRFMRYLQDSKKVNNFTSAFYKYYVVMLTKLSFGMFKLLF